MANPAPINLVLSGLTVNEGDLIGVPVGGFTAIGSDGKALAPAGLTFSLVSGDGSDDNSRFRIAGGQLLAAEVFDREVRSQLKVRIKVSDADNQSYEQTFTIKVNDLANPIAKAPLISAPLAWGSGDGALELAGFFDDPLSTGKVATFQLAPVQLGSNSQATLGSGQIRVLLYDQSGQGAPLSTANLENYLSNNRYSTTFIHRSVPGFVLQGGGFNLSGTQLSAVTSFAAVANEYSSGRSNLRGTIAMAKLGSDPNSATSQWFWSLADNSANLDNQNGGFTVFGRVLGASDLSTLDAMAAIPAYNTTASLGAVFSQLPLSSGNLTINNLLRFSSITIAQQAELSYSLISNSAPDLLQASLSGSQLQLHQLANRQQAVALTIRATNLLGESIDQTLNLQLLRRPTTTASIQRFSDSADPGSPNDTSPSDAAQPSLAGSLAAPLQADEQVRILADGVPIGVATVATGGTAWSFRPAAPLSPGLAGKVMLSAQVESLDGVAGPASSVWTLGLAANQDTLEAPGSELVKLTTSKAVLLKPTPIGSWGYGFSAWNAGSRSSSGQLLPGTGQRLAIQGLDRYGISLRNADSSQVDLDLGDGNHAFFLHDSWTAQSSELSTLVDAMGRSTAARFDRIRSIRLGDCSAAGKTSLLDLTSPDFITGSMTVYGGNRAGSRNVIWGSSADDTVICGGADTWICGGGGHNSLQLGSGADRVQLVANGGADDSVSHFDPSRDRLELWGLAPGSIPSLSLQSDGQGGSVLNWAGNRVSFSGTPLSLPSGGGLPGWVVLG